MDTPNEQREGGGDEAVGKTADLLPFERGPLWWHVRLIEGPEVLVERAHTLLSSERWEEVVVGLTVVTGRCVPEILKTGVLVPKKRHALLFAAYLEQIDEVVGPFELPTLVEADLVLSAWKRVRSQISCTSLSAEEVCARYRPQVAAAARGQFAELVGVDAFADGYTPLLRQVYASIAARYYCPTQVDRSWFMDLVQGVEQSEKDRCVRAQRCDACQRACFTYKIGNGVGNVDGSLGIKLELPGYDLLDCLKERERGEEAEEQVSTPLEVADGDGEIVELASRIVVLDQDGNMDGRQDIKQGREMLEEFKEPAAVDGEDETCEMWVRDETRARFDQVMQQLGVQSDDEALVALLDIDRQRRAVESQVMNRLMEGIKKVAASKESVRSGEGIEREEVDEEDDVPDRVVNALIDTYEEQTYAFQVYLYQQMSQLLLPLVESLGTQDHDPIVTLRALITTYEQFQMRQ